MPHIISIANHLSNFYVKSLSWSYSQCFSLASRTRNNSCVWEVLSTFLTFMTVVNVVLSTWPTQNNVNAHKGWSLTIMSFFTSMLKFQCMTWYVFAPLLLREFHKVFIGPLLLNLLLDTMTCIGIQCYATGTWILLSKG